MSSPSDRRRHRRVGVRLPVQAFLGEHRVAARGHLHDMAEGGLLVLIEGEHAIGASAHIQFFVGGVEHEGTGRVIRTDALPGARNVAIEFAFANDEMIAFVRALVAAPDVERADAMASIERLTLSIV